MAQNTPETPVVYFSAPCPSQQEVVHYGQHQRNAGAHIAGQLLHFAPALLALLAQAAPRPGIATVKQLHDNGGVDVRADAQREQCRVGESAARQHINVTQQVACAAANHALQCIPRYKGHGDGTAQAEQYKHQSR